MASQPTMSRLENSVSRSDLYRIGLALLEIFIESYDQPPKKLTIDIDDTDDPAHGAQQLTLFHAYYDEYYLPSGPSLRRGVGQIDHDAAATRS